MKKVQSTCNVCSLACNLDFYVENEQIVKVLPTKTYPVNKGFSCIKGISLDKQNTKFKPSPFPKIRNAQGELQEVSWDEAYKYVADKLLSIKETYGGDSIAAISTGQLPLEEMALFSHVMRNFLRGHVDGNTRLCMATSVVAHKQSFGFDAPPYTLNDFELSDTIFLIGANPIVTHPIIWDRIRRNPNKKVIVIDPRRSETAQKSDYFYPINGKSDIYLFYGLANILIEKDYLDHDYIEAHTENFDGFKALVSKYTPDVVAEQTGLSVDALYEMAELIHTGKNVSLWWTMGVNQGYEAVRTAQAIINIALMTGNIGRPGTGANSITGQCNAMGSRVFSNTAGLYGGGDYDNAVRREAVCNALQITDEQLINKPTLPYNAIIEKIHSGEIKALWIVSTNPRHSWTNNATFAEAIKKLDLFIVQDIYDDTHTSKDAGVFFPVVSGLKKVGTYINTERRLSAMRPVLAKEDNEKTDFEVFYEVGQALGMGSLLGLWKTPQDTFELMKKCSKGMPCDITGVTYEALDGTHGIQWPFREGDVLTDDERRLFEDGNYYTPSKKAKFVFDEIMENPLPTTTEFPYILNTGRDTVGQWHTQVRSREIGVASKTYADQAYIYIHPTLAKEKGIEQNEIFEVASINGQSARFAARITENVSENQLYAPMHYIETNKLTPSLYDPFSKEPSYKTTPINIYKI
ncbi:molybdopterin oxidoreductase family protein [Niameybacter massiliensis]|uniref:Molybdopterin oxidoreductase family protein n=1 Tax=Holtiella tumoricola TaxID=3018743 RepID=A0AA42J0M0_9FIRM|nr:molybdopterin oxidoreductase family protein [Holtiella tumoricola]MDA3731524.1 molybdopterin oxidoreductase family protein [Holtiella tumoricola]